MKPNLFIASSVESLSLVYAVQENLERDAEVTTWDQMFEPSKYTLEPIIEMLGKADFGVFIFANDDVTRIRQIEYATVRDNVVFELGLFIGQLGKERAFFLIPREIKDFRLPTDLFGLTPLTYDPNRTDRNLRAALAPACNRIREAVTKLSKFTGNVRQSALNEELTILSATWGAEESWLNVADILVAKIKVGHRKISVNRVDFGEPAPYKKKILIVTYIYKGQTNLRTVPEDEILILPEN
jgi:hypothetical protein